MTIDKALILASNTVKAYLVKDKLGRPAIPRQRQRPLFLQGDAGVGKTSIVQQIAQELNIGYVAYPLTHMTRQNAMGLPQLGKMRTSDGQEAFVTNNTMPEVVASVHEAIKAGYKNGILFIDEVNCVSETLAPVMLTLLQDKKFGGYEIPDGWVLMTAGNPPGDVNRSAREFDVVTDDRLNFIAVDSTYSVWKEYAIAHNVHQSILSFLDRHPSDFRSANTDTDGTHVITPRGWEDLSYIIKASETLGTEMSADQVRTVIHDNRVAAEFATYYILWKKYESEYSVKDIIDGKDSPELVSKASKAEVDEKYALTNLVIAELGRRIREHMDKDDAYKEAASHVPAMKQYMSMFKSKAHEAPKVEAGAIKDLIARRKAGHNLSAEYEAKLLGAIEILEKVEVKDAEELVAFFSLKGKMKTDIDKSAEKIAKQTDNAYAFLKKAFGAESENIAILTAELLENKTYGSFFSHSTKTGTQFSSSLIAFNLSAREKETEANIDAFLSENDA
jgi:hypothetical protein